MSRAGTALDSAKANVAAAEADLRVGQAASFTVDAYPERTREIGIRLAIGAQESQVLLQFLVEAVVLSLCGGLVGIAVGLGLAALATDMMQLPFLPDPVIALIAFGFSAAVGVVFG